MQKVISGFGGLYSVTKDGKVFREYSITPLSLGRYPNGYLYVRLTYKGVRTNALLHRIIAGAYIPNPENKPCINHKNGNKQDNCTSNLEWCTHEENAYHAYNTGLSTMNKKIVLNRQTGIFYDSIKAAAHSIGWKHNTLVSQLLGRSPNKTFFILC